MNPLSSNTLPSERQHGYLRRYGNQVRALMLGIGCLAIVLWLGCHGLLFIVSGSFFIPTQPSEQTLLATFAAHRPIFEHLQEVFDRSQRSCRRAACSEAERQAMEQIGINEISAGAWPDDVWFEAYIWGIGPSAGRTKGYVYFTTPPEPELLVPALDDLTSGPLRVRYRRIDEHWYMYMITD